MEELADAILFMNIWNMLRCNIWILFMWRYVFWILFDDAWWMMIDVLMKCRLMDFLMMGQYSKWLIWLMNIWIVNMWKYVLSVGVPTTRLNYRNRSLFYPVGPNLSGSLRYFEFRSNRRFPERTFVFLSFSFVLIRTFDL